MTIATEPPPIPAPPENAPPETTATVHGSHGWTSTIWLLLVVLCGALFLDGLDISMVGVALPSIGAPTSG